MKNKKCPFCEGEISPTAKKCRHCGEWLGKKIKGDNNKTDLLKKIKDFLGEYGIFLIIGGFIIYYLLKPSNHTDTNDTQKELDYESNGYTTNITYKIKGEGYNKYIETGDYGYTFFPNQIGECNINSEEDIKNLIKAIDNAKIGDIIDWSCSNKESNTNSNHMGNGKNISIFLDNSYSEDLNGDIDKKGPSQRLSTLGNYLNNQKIPEGSSINLTFIFTIQPNDNSEEPDNNLYQFYINPSIFKAIYKKEGKGSISYDEKRHTINRWDIKLSSSLGSSDDKGCINKDNYSFICYDAESIYNKIEEIYNKSYDTENKHTNNMLMKNLRMNEDRFDGEINDEVRIFTNGEFKIGYEWETMYLSQLKQEYKTQRGHDQGADKTHNLTEFSTRHANRYQKDKNEKYRSFWLDTIDILRPELPVCDGVKIYIIGLTRSSEFTQLAKEIYEKIFSPCIVLFEK